MKKLILLVITAITVITANAQTIAITPTSLEVIGASAVTRAFYDLDDVFISYKTGTVKVYEAATGNQLFTGDTSEVSVTGASHWGAKAAKFTLWYQHVTHTNGYRYWIPKRGVQAVYKTSDTSVKLVHGITKKVLIATALDSVKISGITTVSNILTYLRGQYFQEGSRDAMGLPNTATIAAGAAAGASPTVAIVGSGTAGKITLTTGTTATTTGVLCTVTLPVVRVILPAVPEPTMATVGEAPAAAPAAIVAAFRSPLASPNPSLK